LGLVFVEETPFCGELSGRHLYSASFFFRQHKHCVFVCLLSIPHSPLSASFHTINEDLLNLRLKCVPEEWTLQVSDKGLSGWVAYGHVLLDALEGGEKRFFRAFFSKFSVSSFSTSRKVELNRSQERDRGHDLISAIGDLIAYLW
jgi:hypothetical protein